MTPDEEIHRRFWKKMEPGGEIDQIFKGATVKKRPPVSDAEIALIRQQIDVQMVEYEAAINAAANWYAEWKERSTPKGFRCKAGAA